MGGWGWGGVGLEREEVAKNKRIKWRECRGGKKNQTVKHDFLKSCVKWQKAENKVRQKRSEVKGQSKARGGE